MVFICKVFIKNYGLLDKWDYIDYFFQDNLPGLQNFIHNFFMIEIEKSLKNLIKQKYIYICIKNSPSTTSATCMVCLSSSMCCLSAVMYKMAVIGLVSFTGNWTGSNLKNPQGINRIFNEFHKSII